MKVGGNATCDLDYCMLKGTSAKSGGAMHISYPDKGRTSLRHSTLHSNVAAP